MKSPLERIPITIISGFLGAGKTTLLQRILTEKHGKKIAVIENEFANLDIDASLIKSKSDVLVELFNGCICCSIQGELMASLLEIANRDEPVDQVVIETTGVANPSNLVQGFLSDHLLRAFFRLDAVVTVVDAKHFHLHASESQDFRDQIAVADVIVLNKKDLAGEAETERVESIARAINRAAEIVRTEMCQVPLARIFDRREYENEAISLEKMGAGKPTDLPSLVSSLSLEINGALDEPRLMAWFQKFVAANHERMFRTKGILGFTGYERPVVIQGVHMVFSAVLGERELLPKDKSRLIFIGRDLPKEEILAGVRQALPERAAFDFGGFQPVSSVAAVSPVLLPQGGFAEDLRVRIV